MTMCLRCAALITTLVATPVLAQPAERAAAMRKLDLWVGSWKGTGWSLSPTGTREEFELAETVQRRAGGTVLMVEGHGATKARVPTHDGIVLVSYDDRERRYRWTGHDFANGATDAVVTILDAGLQWTTNRADAGMARFTIHFDEHVWRETGEFSADGKAWTQFMEVVLNRAR